jgi:transposase-like protein
MLLQPRQDHRMSRTRYTEKEKARIIRDFEHNDQSTAAFCLQHGVSYQTFMNWRRRAATNPTIPKPSPTFVEFEFGAAPSTLTPVSGLVELELGGGIILRIHPMRHA